jgi:hypothetical protein
MKTEAAPNFWDRTHPLSEAYETFTNALVPAMGSCSSLQGELLRAASRIGYDWYNNGWGCNNWSGAVNMIGKHFHQLPVQPSEDIIDNFDRSLNWVKDFSHGEPAPSNDAIVEEHVTRLTEVVVQALIDNPEFIPNDIDMFKYQEDDYEWPPEEDDTFGWDYDDEEE